eukprot:8137405-Alexandrium_andersonii.AAC.1
MAVLGHGGALGGVHATRPSLGWRPVWRDFPTRTPQGRFKTARKAASYSVHACFESGVGVLTRVQEFPAIS